MTIAHWTPFGNANWLGVKLLLVVAYVLVGMKALKSKPRSTQAWLFYRLTCSIFKHENIIRAPLNPVNPCKDRTAGARFRIFHQDIIQLILKNWLRSPLEIRNNWVKAPIIQVVLIYMDNVFV